MCIWYYMVDEVKNCPDCNQGMVKDWDGHIYTYYYCRNCIATFKSKDGVTFEKV